MQWQHSNRTNKFDPKASNLIQRSSNLIQNLKGDAKNWQKEYEEKEVNIGSNQIVEIMH